MGHKILITNNPLVVEKYPDEVIKVEGMPSDVLRKAMEYVMNGYHLFSLPLPPNVSLFKSPYRTVVVEFEGYAQTRSYDLLLLQNALDKLSCHIAEWNKIKTNKPEDYAFLDLDFLDNLLGRR